MKVKQIAFSVTDCLHAVGEDGRVYWFRKADNKWVELENEGTVLIPDIGA